MILLTLYKLLDYKTFIQKRSSIRTLNVMDRGPSKVFMIFKTYNRKLPILGYPLLDGRQSAPV